MSSPFTVSSRIGAIRHNGSIKTAGKGYTALAGGGQTGATQLLDGVNQVDTVASTADSVTLPQAAQGKIVVVVNNGANSMQVFGRSAETINGVATATGVAHPAGETGFYVCTFTDPSGVTANTWFQLLGETGGGGPGLFTSITGTAATFPINGLAAAQGGSVTMTGGTSSTSGNNGGAAGVVGGTPGATGNGGIASITGGPGGGTSGTGGAANVTAGSPTSGNGSNVTLTASSGAGGTNAGGNVNAIPGAAVSTGIPGEFQINSVAGTFEASWQQYLGASVPVSGTSYPFFLADRAYRVKVASVYQSSAVSPTVDIVKDTGTTAPGAGTTILTGAISFGAANTRVVGTLSSTVATLTLAAGDRLSAKWGGTVGSLTGGLISVLLVPV